MNPATGDKFNVDYVILDGDELTPLLSRKAAESLKLITLNYGYLDLALLVLLVLKTILTCLMVHLDPGGKIHLTLEPNAEPVVRPPRTLRESLNSSAKHELGRLEHTGVLVKVDQPTDWVNKMYVAKKRSGAVRICIDPRPLNLSLKREH